MIGGSLFLPFLPFNLSIIFLFVKLRLNDVENLLIVNNENIRWRKIVLLFILPKNLFSCGAIAYS